VERQRLLLTQDYEEGSSVSELAEIHGISRKTIYKWLKRHDQQGVAGLADLSRRPLNSPHEVSSEVEQAIVEARHRWKWGPRKLRVKLCEQDETRLWPSISTMASILKNKGLVVERRRRTRTPVLCLPGNEQRRLVCRLQGIFSCPRRHTHRSPDHHRCLQPISVTLPDCGAHRFRPCPGRV
jgi:transposase